jgi:hypothetical protein
MLETRHGGRSRTEPVRVTEPMDAQGTMTLEVVGTADERRVTTYETPGVRMALARLPAGARTTVEFARDDDSDRDWSVVGLAAGR